MSSQRERAGLVMSAGKVEDRKERFTLEELAAAELQHGHASDPHAANPFVQPIDQPDTAHWNIAAMGVEASIARSHRRFIEESLPTTQGASHNTVLDHDDTLLSWRGIRKPIYGNMKNSRGRGATPGAFARQQPSEMPEQMNRPNVLYWGGGHSVY